MHPAPGATYDPGRVCLDGTREDVFDEVKEWAGSEECAIFWLYGAAGSGKSSVSASVAHKFKKSLGGSFVCKRDSPVLRDAHRVLPTIAYRLAKACPSYGCLVAEVLHKEGEIGSDGVTRQAEELFFGPLQALQDQKIGLPSFLIVVDALDELECPPGDSRIREDLVQAICRAQTLAPWLKFFVASRPSEDIRRALSFPNKTHSCIKLDLMLADNTKQDISVYLNHCLQDIIQRRGIVASELWPTSKQREILLMKSCGLFMWVSTMHKFILGGVDLDQRLGNVLEGQNSNKAEQGLYDLYTKVLLSVDDGSAPDNTTHIRTVLSLIVATSKRTPLPIPAIAYFANSKDAVVISILANLQSVIPELGHDDKQVGVSFYHPSFLDYMEQGLCPSHLQYAQEELSQVIGSRCLDHLQGISGLRFNICQLESSYRANTDVQDLSKKIDTSIPALLKYSCLYWADHVAESKFNISKDLQAQAESLLNSEKLFYWIEILSLLGATNQGVYSLNKLKEHPSVSKNFKNKWSSTITNTVIHCKVTNCFPASENNKRSCLIPSKLLTVHTAQYSPLVHVCSHMDTSTHRTCKDCS